MNMAVILQLTVYFQSMVELWIDYLLYSLSVMYYLSTGSLDGSLHVNLENGSADVFVARSENVFIDTKQGKNFIFYALYNLAYTFTNIQMCGDMCMSILQGLNLFVENKVTE